MIGSVFNFVGVTRRAIQGNTVALSVHGQAVPGSRVILFTSHNIDLG